MLQKLLKKFNWFEWMMILIVVSFSFYFALTDTISAWWYILINTITAISGILCVVLCAKGKKEQYIWGFFNILGYIVIATLNKYYGEVGLNLLYYLPTQFIGFWYWGKHMNAKNTKVQTRKMNLAQLLTYTAVCMIAILSLRYLLLALGGNATWVDSTTTVLSIVANTLMIMRYQEQWLLWILVDILTIVLWVIAKDPIMITMWTVYLLNAIYGYFNWRKLNKI